MLSILIPTYNYDIYSLVRELNEQCLKLNSAYEIICQDDASNSILNQENNKINDLNNCFFCCNTQNLGRSKNRNSLAEKAKFDWLLFLDCDTFPTKDDFIKKYIDTIYTSEVVFGGLKYKSEKPEESQLLRWTYGRKREAIPLQKRLTNPSETALTSNLFIKKNVFLKILFDETILEYGYEDYLFFSNLKQKKIVVTHIENPVYHLGLDTSEQFLEKTKIASENLVNIAKNYPALTADNKIIAAFATLKKIKAISIFKFLFKALKGKMERNLVSKNPSLLVFDLYKLGSFIQKSEN